MDGVDVTSVNVENESCVVGADLVFYWLANLKLFAEEDSLVPCWEEERAYLHH